MTRSSMRRNMRKFDKKNKEKLKAEVEARVEKTLKDSAELAKVELAKANEDLRSKVRDEMMNSMTGVREPKVAKMPLKEAIWYKFYLAKQFIQKSWFVTKCSWGFGHSTPTAVCAAHNPKNGDIALIVHMADTTTMTIALSKDSACTIGSELLQYINMGVEQDA